MRFLMLALVMVVVIMVMRFVITGSVLIVNVFSVMMIFMIIVAKKIKRT